MGKNDSKAPENNNAKAPAPAPEPSKPEGDAAGTAEVTQETANAPAAEAIETPPPAADQASESQNESTGEPAGGDTTTAASDTPPATDPVTKTAAPQTTVTATAEQEPKAPETSAAPEASTPPAESKPIGSVVDAKPIGLQRSAQDEALLNAINQQLDDYCAKMGRAVPVTPEAGAGHQLGLYRTVSQILRIEDGALFHKAWALLLQKAEEHREGAFHEARMLRFMERLKLDEGAKTSFQNLLHIVMSTADPKARLAALRLIDIPSAIKRLPVSGAIEKLVGFYAP